MKTLLKAFVTKFPSPQFTRFRNLRVFEWMNQHAPGKRVLNLGSGVKRFDHYLHREVKPLNLDIDITKPDLDIVADGHNMPFKSACFDIVFSIAVLEHVKKPWIVAAEINQLLKPGGYIVLELPFLNVIHDEHDYFRFTGKGIRSLFDSDRYDIVFEQVGSGGGSFLSVYLYTYFKQFVPGKYLKILWSILMGYPLSLIKYLDILINNSSNLHLTANSFSFIARKK
jgi:SAM-dependent methyltransferase